MSFICPDTIERCSIQLTNTAGNNMRAYIVSSTTSLSESLITNQMNADTEIWFRRGPINIVLVSLDQTNPQIVSIRYLAADILKGATTLALAFSMIYLSL